MPAAERADVSVLTPVLNEQTHIREAARGMLEQRFDGRIEFLFVDGRSSDDTVAILRDLAARDERVRILDNSRGSTPIALNIGLAEATGEFVVRMDAHTHYPPDYIARGVERLRQGGAEHVSGPQLAHGEGPWSRRVALALTSRLGTGEADFRHATGGEIEVDSGFTGVWRKETLERQGGWDEEWHNDQDSELAARIRKDGGRIVCLPEMAADYVPRDSLKRLWRQYWRYGFYRAKTSGRHPESMRRSHVLAPGLVVTALAALLLRGRLAWLPRLGLGLYAGVLAATSLSEAKPGQRADAASLPLVFLTMHAAWGLGFLAGSARFGPPLSALLGLVRR